MAPVVQTNELIQLLLGIGVLIFMLANRSRLSRIADYPLLFASFAVMLTGWILTVLEGLFWPDLLNTIEHFTHFVAAALLLLWCVRTTQRKGNR